MTEYELKPLIAKGDGSFTSRLKVCYKKVFQIFKNKKNTKPKILIWF